MKNRNRAIDCSRGAAIILIMMYHLVHRAENGIIDQALRECVWGLIPFFFIITGYYYTPGKYSVSKEIKRKIKTLLIPAICITGTLLAVFGIYYAFVHGYTLSDWFNDVVYTYLRPEFTNILMKALGKAPDSWGPLYQNLSPVWFVWTMCFACLLFYPSASVSYSKPANFVFIIVLNLIFCTLLYVFVPPLSWNLNQVPAYVVIMLIASLLGRMNFIEKLSQIGTHIIVLTMICAFIAHYFLFAAFGTDEIYAGKLGTAGALSPVLYVIESFIWGYAFCGLGIILDRIPRINAVLSWVGKNTLYYLLLHDITAVVACDAMHTYDRPGTYWYVENLTSDIIMKSMISFVFAFVCCSFVVYIKDKKW